MTAIYICVCVCIHPQFFTVGIQHFYPCIFFDYKQCLQIFWQKAWIYPPIESTPKYVQNPVFGLRTLYTWGKNNFDLPTHFIICCHRWLFVFAESLYPWLIKAISFVMDLRCISVFFIIICDNSRLRFEGWVYVSKANIHGWEHYYCLAYSCKVDGLG